jgi:outer membrane receptor for ferric coprogen and ferric-rhodotorulic acid
MPTSTCNSVPPPRVAFACADRTRPASAPGFGLAITSLALLLNAMSGVAQTTDLDEVTVTGKALAPGSRLELTARQSPVSVESADAAKLADRGVQSLADSARGFTGLTSALRPGAPGVFSARGFVENGIAVLFDGIRVGGATITMRNADPFNYDRIELLRGPASVLHGQRGRDQLRAPANDRRAVAW